MSKLPRVSAKKVIILLHKFGYNEFSCNGGHRHFKKAGIKGKITVPYHTNKELKIKLLKNILKFLSIKENIPEEEIIETLKDI